MPIVPESAPDPNVRIDHGGWISGPMLSADVIILAGLRAARDGGEDVAETIARVLARFADELGSADAVLSRPGSWESALVRQLIDGTP